MAAGAIAVAFSIIWRAPDMLRNILISPLDLTIGLVLGVMYLVTFAISIGAILQPVHVTLGLEILNWTLLVDALATIVIGSIVWYTTLKEQANFHIAWSQQSQQIRQGVQDMLQCCGYFNSTDLGVIAGFCADPVKAANSTPCVGPVTSEADFTLNNIFTTIYGFMAVIIAVFLASMCVIKVRIESERFRRIDEKRGGRGFV
jgi:hypothetical protein